jgi:hypothetical protein
VGVWENSESDNYIPFGAGCRKTKMLNVKLQHKWGHNKVTRLRKFSRNKSCVVQSSVKIKRDCVIFLVTKVASSKVPSKIKTMKILPKQL